MSEPRDRRTRQLVLTRASDISPFRYRGEWGPWHLDADVFVLWTDAGGYRYEVDLDECRSSAEVLDWVCQIAAKEWGGDFAGNAAITAGLVNALADILHPQANLCSWGRGKRLSKAQIRYLATQAPRDRELA